MLIRAPCPGNVRYHEGVAFYSGGNRIDNFPKQHSANSHRNTSHKKQLQTDGAFGNRCGTGAVQVWFHRLYQDLGFAGASSHSGRRTFITRTAKKIVEAGGSLRDVQELAGHTSLSTTQRYIQGRYCGQAARGRSVMDPQHPVLLAQPRRAGFLTAK
jgi:integrase